MTIRISEAEARRLQKGPRNVSTARKGAQGKIPRLTSHKPAAGSARARCVECGAIVGKGRKAPTCAPCDLVALIAKAGLPAPVREVKFALPERGYRADLAYPHAGLLIEVDGGAWRPGGGRHGGDEDKLKGNLAAALGWRVMHFSPQQIAADGDACVALIRRCLG